jgi:hypothetical protein
MLNTHFLNGGKNQTVKTTICGHLVCKFVILKDNVRYTCSELGACDYQAGQRSTKINNKPCTRSTVIFLRGTSSLSRWLLWPLVASCA